jgi:helicase
MNIDELAQYNFPQAILDVWKATEGETLLPVQEMALSNGLLDGRSMVIAAPTSSGKTFLSEIALYKQAQEQRKVLYLAPHKAIIEEKYYDFVNKYQHYGMKVVVSSGDHAEFDQDIQQGSFDVGLFTYEKLAMLLVAGPNLASSCGLLIVDEIQMLADGSRGAELELLLTKFLTLSANAQILGLSAAIDRFGELDKWLRAYGLSITERPIELREGIYTPDGMFKYREWNSKKSGEELLVKAPSNNIETMLDALVAHLLISGEQLLIFRMDKPKTLETATRLAKILSHDPATSAIEALQALEITTSREQLIECLRKGIAFHNADLMTEERLIVETAFREGHIRVICSTSTLAMGINLPTKTTIIADAVKWERDEKTDKFEKVPLTVAEYRNMSGRAGRYKFKDTFGRSILLANDQLAFDQYRVNYIGGNVKTIASSLGNRSIVQQVLDIIVSGLGKSEDSIIDFMMHTFAGFRTWTTPETKAVISIMIHDAIQQCLKMDLIAGSNVGNLEPTNLGRVCANKKISLAAFAVLREWLLSSQPLSNFVALYHVVHAPEVSRLTFNMSTDEYRSNFYLRYILDHHEGLGVSQDIVTMFALSHQEKIGYEETRRLKMILLATAMIDGVQYRDIEKSFRTRAGIIRGLCEYLTWLIDTAANLAPLFGRTNTEAKMLNILSERIHYGVPEAILPLARLRISMLTRSALMQLLESGYDTPDKILDADISEFQGVISRKLAINLHENIEQSLKNRLETRKRNHLTRLQKIGADTAVLSALYEQTGTALEITLCDLFVPPFCNCLFERVTKQREGEPDNLLHLPDGNVIAFSVTARETQNVSMKKAGEIIAGAARFRPVARIVVGRPDFHELAIKNAQEIANDGTNFKILPMFVLAEMFVRVREGRLKDDAVMNILRNQLGYISIETLSESGASS